MKESATIVTNGTKAKQPGRFWFLKSQAHCPPQNTKKSLYTTQVGLAHVSL